MSRDNRYEVKFVLDESKLAMFKQWMYFSTELSPAFESRYVNSLYFDDVSYQSVKDNLAGIADRRKMRLRWYHYDENCLEDISSPVLELKYREGRLGYKKSMPVPGLKEELLEVETGSIFSRLNHELAVCEDAHGIFDDHYIPTLHVSYLRDYYEGLSGLRATIDRNINFASVTPHSKLLEDVTSPYPMSIAEIKFSPELKPRVSELFRNLHLTPKRHSKYLVGLSIFGQVVYI